LHTNKLRIGFIIDENPIPAWKYYIIEKVSQLNFCELFLINQIIDINKEKNIKKPFFQSLLLNYEQRKMFESPSSFKEEKLSNFLKVFYISKKHISNNELIIDNDKKIQDLNLDVLINLSSLKVKGKITDSIKFGIWYFNPISEIFDDLIGYDEILNRIPIITTNLQCIINNEKNEKIITRCYSPTNFLSLTRSSNVVNWNKSRIILLTLEKLYNLNKSHLYIQNETIINNIVNSSSILGNYQYAKLFLKIIQKSMKLKLYNKFYFDQWILMFNFDAQFSTSFSKFQSLEPEKDRFWADPHIIFEDNNYYIFLEEFQYSQNKGHITVLQINKNGNIQGMKKILEKPYHLSYPFVFKFEDKYYMIPETHSNHTIELYQCTDFPFTWKFSKNLMTNIDAVDSTLLHHKDKWWLFTCISKYDQIKTWDDLFLFYTDDPIKGTWKSHPCNPIVSDIRKARNAGKIFLHDGNMIRPSQDSSRGYGTSIVLNKIYFDEEKYNEIIFKILQPNWSPKITGLHTIQYDSGLTIIDAKMKRRR